MSSLFKQEKEVGADQILVFFIRTATHKPGEFPNTYLFVVDDLVLRWDFKN